MIQAAEQGTAGEDGGHPSALRKMTNRWLGSLQNYNT